MRSIWLPGSGPGAWRCFLAGIALALPVLAQAEGLPDLYGRALQGDPALAAARYALEAAGEKPAQARAGLLPQATLTGSAGYAANRTTFSGYPTSPRDIKTASWTVQITQPVLDRKAWAASSQADALLEQARAQYVQARQDLMLRLCRACFDVLGAQEGIVAAQAQVDAVEQLLAQAKASYAAGISSITDVYEARSRLELAIAQRIAAESELESRRIALEAIVGPLDGDALHAASGDAPLPVPAAPDVARWVDEAALRNPAVLAQAAAVRVAEGALRKVAAEHLPTLVLVASYGDNYASGSTTLTADIGQRNRAAQLALQMSVPLYAGGGISARQREAAAMLRKAQAELDGARRQTLAQARQSWAAVQQGLAQARALDLAVQSSALSVQANRKSLQVGLRTTADVLHAEQQLYTARRDRIRARHEVLLATLRLKAAAGVLDDADVLALQRFTESRDDGRLSYPLPAAPLRKR